MPELENYPKAVPNQYTKLLSQDRGSMVETGEMAICNSAHNATPWQKFSMSAMTYEVAEQRQHFYTFLNLPK